MSGFKRRQLFSYFAAATGGALVGFVAGRAQASKPHLSPGPGHARQGWVNGRVSVVLERPDGTALDSYWQRDSRYTAGELGERYNIRITNHEAHRVEAVVSVDGRDVVSGELGDFAKQRGYVIPAYGSVLIDGFRQSLTHAAAFRFSKVQDGYSSRKGTPQHTGVIGVAVFDEKPRPQPRRPVYQAPPADPRPYDYPQWNEGRRYGRDTNTPAAGASRPADRSMDDLDSSESQRGRGNRDAPSRRTGTSGSSKAAKPATRSPRKPREDSAPRGDAASAGAESKNLGTAGPAATRGRHGPSHYVRPQPEPPREPEHLGTKYGESRYSQVREVSFKRAHAKTPDAMLTLYYDSHAALRTRGVIVDPPPQRRRAYAPEPKPFPEQRFAAPPPPRRY